MPNVRRLGFAMGVEIAGLDLSREVEDETIERISELWRGALLICFRGQRLSPERQAAFCRRFGELDEPKGPSNLSIRADIPAIHPIVSKPVVVNGQTFRSAFADEWHSDQSYTTRPGTGTFLHAVTLPDVGGDTMFANTCMAFENLSPTMQRMLEGLEGVHDATLSNDFRRQPPEVQAERRKRHPPAAHPVVSVHPETGRKFLFVGCRLRKFAGMSEEESRPLIEFLNRHAVRPEFVYRHRWSAGDLLMWDNRGTLHHALRDYDPGQLREMQRCVQRAPLSGRPYEEDAASAARVL